MRYNHLAMKLKTLKNQFQDILVYSKDIFQWKEDAVFLATRSK